jgi:hypothetical protein
MLERDAKGRLYEIGEREGGGEREEKGWMCSKKNACRKKALTYLGLLLCLLVGVLLIVLGRGRRGVCVCVLCGGGGVCAFAEGPRGGCGGGGFCVVSALGIIIAASAGPLLHVVGRKAQVEGEEG